MSRLSRIRVPSSIDKILHLLLTLILFPLLTNALHSDEAGLIDFHIETTGHARLTNAFSVDDALISSGQNCRFAARNVTSGDILWSRDGCGSATSKKVSILKMNNLIHSLDGEGILRVWNKDGGMLSSDLISETLGGELMEMHGEIVIKAPQNVIWMNGRETVSAKDILKNSRKTDTDAVETILDVGAGLILAGWVKNGVSTLNNLSLVEVTGKGVVKMKNLRNFSAGNTAVRVDSLRIWSKYGGIVGITSEGHLLKWTEEHGGAVLSGNEIMDLPTEEDNVRLVKVDPDGPFLKVTSRNLRTPTTSDVEVSIFTTINGQIKQIKMSGNHNGPATAIATCHTKESAATVVYTVHKSEGTFVLTTSHLSAAPDTNSDIIMSTSGSSSLPISPSVHGKITYMRADSTSDCSNIVFSTSSFTTYLHPYWTAEESLSTTTQSLFFDHSTPHDTMKNKLFGFHKLVVLLSSSAGRVFGMDTLAPHKGKVLYSVLLPQDADRHVLVHGGTSSASGVHGAFSSQKKSHVVLILSFFDKLNNHSNIGNSISTEVQWMLMDTNTGAIISTGRENKASNSVTITGDILNVIPFQGEPANLQMAMVLYELKQNDETQASQHEYGYEILPSGAQTNSEFQKIVQNSALHGMFVHSVSESTGDIKSFRLAGSSTGDNKLVELELMGQLTFPSNNEKITSVHYPPRGEVIQSPTTILGDDSLLLKYLNPHLAVVVTEATPEHLAKLENDPASAPFVSSSQSKKRIPQGVSSSVTADSPPPPPSPSTLFINIIDTTTAKILHRASHIHKTTSLSSSTTTHVPVTISENWIVYSYFNHKSKRTDLGVLTLYEGMIDKQSLSLFKSPEQDLSFSTFSSPKPIVLQKVYTYGKAIKGLSVTRTARGISTKNVITVGPGGVATIDARFLDPRRPSGELKQSEKIEGLMKYHPILPHFPQRVLSYWKDIDAVKISTASTNVESQSLVLVYGGKDLFFTRVEPSKGFDLLPESFNKSLLGLVVVGLLVGYGALKKVCTDKLLKIGWA